MVQGRSYGEASKTLQALEKMLKLLQQNPQAIQAVLEAIPLWHLPHMRAREEIFDWKESLLEIQTKGSRVSSENPAGAQWV